MFIFSTNCHLGGTQHGYNEVGGAGEGQRGGGLVVVQKYKGSVVYRGGGGPEAYTTLHKHATCTGGGGVGGGGACWPLTIQSTAIHWRDQWWRMSWELEFCGNWRVAAWT
jgi:hypothetical protein